MGNSARPAPGRHSTILSLLRYRIADQTLRVAVLLGIWLIPLLVMIGSVRHAPAWQEAAQVQIDLAPGHDVVLGHHLAKKQDDLGSPHADTEHIRLLRTTSGDWRLENVSATKQVLWTPHDGKERRVREWALQPGGRFTIGQQLFTVKAVTTDGVTLQFGEQIWRYNGVQSALNNQLLPPCDPLSVTQWIRQQLLTAWRKPPLSLGGGVRCATRLGLADVIADSALLVPNETGYALQLGPGARIDGAPVQVENAGGGPLPLRQLTVPLHIHDQIIIGYTHYQVLQTNGVLILAITARGQRWLVGQPLPGSVDGVQVVSIPLTVARPAPWEVVRDMGLTILAVFGASVLWGWNRSPLGPSRWRQFAFIGCLALALAWFALYWFHRTQVPLLWAYASLWIALLGWVWLGRRTDWSALLVGALLWLLGWGLIAQWQLGIGAEESGWMRYGLNTAVLGNVAAWLVLAGVLFWQSYAPRWRFSNRSLSGVQWVLGIVLLLLLVLQGIAGDETGVAGFQPIELVKLLLIVAAALTLAERLDLRGWDLTFNKLRLWLRYSSLVVFSVACTVTALGILHDLSPIFLLVIATLALFWAYWRIHWDRRWRWGGQWLVVAAVTGLTYGVVQLYAHPDWFPRGLQSDRIQVWAAPERYPHSGYQLHQGLSEIRAGGWLGLNAGHLPSGVQPGVNGAVMRVPAVQDDFAPAFFLNRYGGLLGALLVTVQLLLVLSVLRIGTRALMWTQQPDYRQQLFGHFVYFTLWGGGGLLIAHFLVSWGTNLGLLPVMGQPMPFLSAAGSHLVLLLMPLIALALVLELAQAEGERKQTNGA